MPRFAGAAGFFNRLLGRGAHVSDDAIAAMPAGVHAAAERARLQNLTRLGTEGAELEARNVFANHQLAHDSTLQKSLRAGLPNTGNVLMNTGFAGVMGAQMMGSGTPLPQALAISGWGAGVPLVMDTVAGPLAAWIARKSAPAGMSELALLQRAEGAANIAKTASMVGSFLIPNLPAEMIMRDQQAAAAAQQQQPTQQQPITSMGLMTGSADPLAEDELDQLYRAQMAGG
jgi:hypothetical protein